jgi:hypothetical protein
MVLPTQLSAVLYPGSRVTSRSFLNLRLCFRKFSRPGTSLLRSKSVILLVDSLYAEAIEAVGSRAALFSSSSELIWILGEINSEAKSWNRFQSVNFTIGSKDSYFQYYPVNGKRLAGYLSPECQRQRLLTAGHSCAQQFRARHHYP